MDPIKSVGDYETAFSGTYVAKDIQSKKAKAFELAWQIRNIEIDLYWKRATYFWAFIAAAIVAFGVIVSAKQSFEPRQSELLVLFGCLGVVFSFSWFCVNQGSKFWQENWETHIDLLEDEALGPLYKTILMKEKATGFRRLTSPQPISVSRINTLISISVTVFWIFLTLMYLGIPDKTLDWWKITIVVLTFAYCAFLRKLSRSDLRPPQKLEGSKLRVISRFSEQELTGKAATLETSKFEP